jgi:hypothetical protein
MLVMGIRGLASLIAICVMAMLAAPAAAQVKTIGAGPIWSNDDAQGKCPTVCARDNMGWQGVWRTTRGMQSECDCVGRAGERHGSGWNHPGPDWGHHHGSVWDHGGANAGGSGNSCRVPSVRQCRGCAVTCRAGQTAHCAEGDVGIFRGPNDSICAHDAKCECH